MIKVLLEKPFINQLILIFVITLILLAFYKLAGFAVSGGTPEIDQYIILAFRHANDLSDPIGPKWVEEMMRDITALGGVAILASFTFFVTVFLLIENKPKLAMALVLTIASGMLVSFSLKYGITRPRPDLVPHGSYVYTASFPSGHAMLSALVYFSLAGMLSYLPVRKRVKTYFFIVAAIFTLAIGVSRVYLGVHWPTDVLAGWLMGIGWALITLLIVRFLKMKGVFASKKPVIPNN
ncbi:phosphatase PAP2 family protein [Aliiglaciecola lipolytica]|uniref:undecaprenyl-diphosphate phosphatase n=1 Tax=Aliiglaciecola lipolytica E3 TaxID=1127673 RepID=K6Y8T1_9ALTE|nr:phosphatase PAP2 family protein [Aliiglaciecola lipolytica]GAC14617.1 PA-phosphatase related phosphoesterase [Aliiglaciecola lipolytica E3]